jgi:hypothetical protein
MGVLEGGTPYLSGRSLAALSGVAPSAIIKQAQLWSEGKRNKLGQMLVAQGFNRDSLYFSITVNGTPVNAYTDDVCTIVLEYYAFESEAKSPKALANFRKLASASLRLFIYRSTGYDPQNRIPEKWTQFHDRLLLNPTPLGFFSVFREMSDIVLTSIQRGLIVDSHTIPDGSVGIYWAKHWKADDLEEIYGLARKHPHAYPSYFPQAQANPFIEAWVYPLAALGAFRMWMQDVYLPEKFRGYLEGKVAKGFLQLSAAELILSAFDGSENEALPVASAAPALPPRADP